MKRISLFFLLAMLMSSMIVNAQNIQLHKDFGHALYDELSGRPSMTATLEMFKPDKLGSTFTFVDLDFQSDGMAGAYWEIFREFNLTKNRQWAVHVEYNGGLSSDEELWTANRFQHAILLGGAWNWASKDFSKTFSVQLMYKYYFKNRHYDAHAFSGFQLTEVWGMQFAKGACTFSGFCDLWYDPNANGKLIFLSEPQFWYNFNTLKGWKGVNLSLGTEVEISNNFVWNDFGQHNKFYVIPTIAAKWTF